MLPFRVPVIWFVIILLVQSGYIFVGEEKQFHYNDDAKERSDDIVGMVTSMLKITNPQRIIQYFNSSVITYLPTSLVQDLRVLQLVCHSNLTVLDLFQKELEIFNFTVHLPSANDYEKMDNNHVALRVGHFRIKWDSYLRPSINIKVSDVDIMIEFTNLLLSRTNWNELHDLGFPPKFLYFDQEEENNPNVIPSSSFIRIRSLDLTGNVKLHTQSRPLENQHIFPDLLFDLGMLNDLNNRVQSVVSKKDEESNKINDFYKDRIKGCTTEEFYKILESFFYEKLQDVLEDIAFDLMTNYMLDKNFEESNVVRRVKKISKQIKKSAENYVLGVAEKAGSMLGENLISRLLG